MPTLGFDLNLVNLGIWNLDCFDGCFEYLDPFRRPRPEARFAVDLLALLQGTETALDKRERWQQTQLDWEQSLAKSLLSHFRRKRIETITRPRQCNCWNGSAKVTFFRSRLWSRWLLHVKLLLWMCLSRCFCDAVFLGLFFSEGGNFKKGQGVQECIRMLWTCQESIERRTIPLWCVSYDRLWRWCMFCYLTTAAKRILRRWSPGLTWLVSQTWSRTVCIHQTGGGGDARQE